jgi:hypothetical protein
MNVDDMGMLQLCAVVILGMATLAISEFVEYDKRLARKRI